MNNTDGWTRMNHNTFKSIPHKCNIALNIACTFACNFACSSHVRSDVRYQGSNPWPQRWEAVAEATEPPKPQTFSHYLHVFTKSSLSLSLPQHSSRKWPADLTERQIFYRAQILSSFLNFPLKQHSDIICCITNTSVRRSAVKLG